MSTNYQIKSVEELIKSRRTIHEFRTEPVPPLETIKRAIDAARWAPNHHMTEPWHFYLPGAETIKALIDLNTDLVRIKNGDAAAEFKRKRWSTIPGWLVLGCDKSTDPVRAREDYAACCCAAQNLMLYLWNENIGVKWNTGKLIGHPRFYEILSIDMETETAVGVFWYGYAQETPVTARKALDQIIVQLP